MKKLSIALLTVVLLMGTLAGCKSESKGIVVGAKDFTEQDVLGNMLQILIEENSDIEVDYKHEMSSNVVFEAMKNGDIDVYIDYTGTVYGNYLGYTELKTTDEVYQTSIDELKADYNLLMLKPMGFNNTYTLSVSKETAEEYGLKTYSDLAKVSGDLDLGATFEVLNRTDGIPNLKLAYDMEFKSETALDGTLRYQAIDNDEVQVIDAFLTDGMLIEFGLVVLEDDLSYFPPYYATPIIRGDTAEKYPELLTILDTLTDTMTDDTMRELNYRVDVLKENPRDVALDFLTTAGLI